MKVLSPSSISRLYAPSTCDLRTWLRAQGEVEEAPDGPFQVFLQEQGIRHEKAVVDRLVEEQPDWIDVDGYANPDALEETRAAVEAGRGFIYQGQLQYETEILGEPVRLIGYPDFLVRRDGGYTIGDAKLARSVYESRADGSRKPKSKKRYIIYQLQLYGWLFSEQFPDLEFDLLVYNGAGEREPVDVPDDVVELRGELERILTIESRTDEPWEPVGWSKCSACGFFDHCWPRAEKEKSVGYVPDVDQDLTRRLKEEGIETYPEIAEQLDVVALADLKSPSAIGKSSRDFGPAERILENVESLVTGEPLRRKSGGEQVAIDPRILTDSHYVMFDLEGVPPELDDWEKIYLWGMQVFGADKGDFRPAFAGSGDQGDKQGWVEFLRIARDLLDQYRGHLLRPLGQFREDQDQAVHGALPGDRPRDRRRSPRPAGRSASDHQGGSRAATAELLAEGRRKAPPVDRAHRLQSLK